MAEVEIHTERVDDVPLLVHKQRQMGIPTVMDEVFEPHGNRQGLSLGWLTCLWLSFVLSEADHRMVEVEPWAARQRQTLSYLSPQPVTEKDFTDDRLADVLGALSQDQAWQEVDAAREMWMRPDSRGSRSTSSTRRSNSGSSSRKSTPRCARLISPGRGMVPPPISPASEIV